MSGSEKIVIKIPVIVEGKYDKARLSSVIDALIITTDGFGVFRNDEKRALIRRLGRDGVIILCDSDGGGKVIRSHLRGMLGGIRVYDLYTPQIEGKERRKKEASKEGYLGVEGIGSGVLREIFESFAAVHPEAVGGESGSVGGIRKSVMYELGYSGGERSQEKRDALCEAVGLPRGMNANAMHRAVEMIMGEEELISLSRTLSGDFLSP